MSVERRRSTDRRLPKDIDKLVGDSFTQAQQDALREVWGTNAETLEEVQGIVHGQSRLLRVGLGMIFVCLLAFGIITVKVVSDEHDQAAHSQMTIQTSRYDGAYRSCQSTNARHSAALVYTAALARINPAAAILASDLLNTLAPLRDGRDGRVTCREYAAQQTSLSVPRSSDSGTG